MVGGGSHEAVRRLASGAVADVTFLALLWLAIVLLVDPVGNFPLDDDWSYGRSVQALVEQHEFRLTDFTAMPLVMQVLWGGLFAAPAGFSFTALRLSTLVLGLVGVLALYLLLREVQGSRGVALLGALSVALNPLYCVLSFTFMTDVPFLVASLLAVLFFVRGAARHRRLELAIGFLFAGIALLIRQPALLLLVAFGAAHLATRGVNRSTVLGAVAPTAVGVGILVGYRELLDATIGVPALYDRPYDPLDETASSVVDAFGQLLDRLVVGGVYLGLFLLPFGLLAVRGFAPRVRRPMLVAAVAVAGVGTVALAWADRSMPSSGNVLYDLGLGPPLLRDTYILGLPHLHRAPTAVWVAVTAAGVLGGALILQHVASSGLRVARRLAARKHLGRDFAFVFALAATVLYLLSIAITGFLDRYLLFAVPFVLVLLAVSGAPNGPRPRARSFVVASALLALYGLFSLAASHDYLSWNRARWAALRNLTDDAGVSYREIDGGFEFNGWYGYDPSYRETPGKSGWWVYGNRYVLAFGPLADYEVDARVAYSRWLPPGTGRILVLRRLERPGEE